MFRRQLEDIANLRKEHPSFFWFSVVILSLYALQMLIKTEITPLGYFSLYSNPMKEQASYRQILPYDTVKAAPVDIYRVKGAGFLMLEILPTRYDILANSDHCNQMNAKLRRIGLGDNNLTDCQDLKAFNTWFANYARLRGLQMSNTVLLDCSFKNGIFMGGKTINDSNLYQ